MDSIIISFIIVMFFGLLAYQQLMTTLIDVYVMINDAIEKASINNNSESVLLDVISPAPDVFYKADCIDVNDDSTVDYCVLDLSDIIKITGRNLNNKYLTISVPTKYWSLILSKTEYTWDGDNDEWNTHTTIVTTDKTVQVKFNEALIYDDEEKVWRFIIKSDVDSNSDGVLDADTNNDGILELEGYTTYWTLYLVRDTTEEQFTNQEFIGLIFAVGSTTKVKLSIGIEPTQ